MHQCVTSTKSRIAAYGTRIQHGLTRQQFLVAKVCPNRLDTRFLSIISKDVRFRKLS